MAYVLRIAALVLLACTLSACSSAQPAVVAVKPVENTELQQFIAESAVPAVVAIQEVVEVVAPEPVAIAVPPNKRECYAKATKLIVRWEITSEAAYTKRYQGVIWPGGASGPTWGVGYDGGHQTRKRIGNDWQVHPQVQLLEETSGITGQAARIRIPEWKAARTPYPLAEQVFIAASLPEYDAAARRALGPKYEELNSGACAGLLSVGYNRGWSMTGDRRSEIRTIDNVCVPNLDNQCIADALVNMCRLWAGTPNGKGLCDRRKDEARVVLQ